MTEESKKIIEEGITNHMDHLEDIVNDALREILQNILPEYESDDLVYAREVFFRGD